MTNLLTEEDFYQKNLQIPGFSDHDAREMAKVQMKDQQYKEYNLIMNGRCADKEFIDNYIKVAIDPHHPLHTLNYPDRILKDVDTMQKYTILAVASLKEMEYYNNIDDVRVKCCMSTINDTLKFNKKNPGFVRMSDYLVQLCEEYVEKYNPHKKAGRKSSTKLISIYLDEQLVETVQSVKELLEKHTDWTKAGLSRALNGKRSTYKGYTFVVNEA